MTITPLFALSDPPTAQPVAGEHGRLEMVAVDRLVIDMSYQRNVTVGSVRNIRRIVSAFDWNKFVPIIGTGNDDGSVSVVDGQHRATAALTLGIESVPVYILACTSEEAAAAFAAINGNVTPVSPVDVWFAQVAAKDPEAMRLKRSMDAASVTIVRRKGGLAVGESRSIGVLRRAFDFYGETLFITILQCITETGNGNAGLLVGAVINGIGRALRTKPELQVEPSRLFEIFDGIDLPAELHASQIEFARTKNPVQHVLTRRINAILKEAGS